MKYLILILIFVSLYFLFFNVDKGINYNYIETFDSDTPMAIASMPMADAMPKATDMPKADAMPKANKGNKITRDDLAPLANSESLCSQYSSQPMVLNEKCNSLTETNCNVTSCCVWLNGTSCVAGDSNGPIFRTTKGKPIDIKKYSFENKLYKFTEKT